MYELGGEDLVIAWMAQANDEEVAAMLAWLPVFAEDPHAWINRSLPGLDDVYTAWADDLDVQLTFVLADEPAPTAVFVHIEY